MATAIGVASIESVDAARRPKKGRLLRPIFIDSYASAEQRRQRMDDSLTRALGPR